MPAPITGPNIRNVYKLAALYHKASNLARTFHTEYLTAMGRTFSLFPHPSNCLKSYLCIRCIVKNVDSEESGLTDASSNFISSHSAFGSIMIHGGVPSPGSSSGDTEQDAGRQAFRGLFLPPSSTTAASFSRTEVREARIGGEQGIHGPEADMNRPLIIVLAMLSVISFGCSDQTGDSSQLTAAERGRKIYVSNCTPCHNDAPALPGAIGPAIAGSSLELVEARVLHAAYPQGYTPKRPSHAMPALPHLEDEVGNLAAYLKAAETR